MNIDEEAVEIVRNHEDLRETDTDRLFIIDPISEEGEVYYLDLRGDNWNTYGYKDGNDKELPEMKPTCLKEVKSEIRGRNSQTLDNFQ